MRIYTRRGDEGETGLLGGGRVSKSHERVAAYGTVDELNAFLGAAAAAVEDAEIRGRLQVIQEDLLSVGASLAAPPPPEGRPAPRTPPLPEDRVAEMEAWIDGAAAETPPLRDFVLPGGTPGAAALHVARTVCRRAERAVVGLARSEAVDPVILAYLNRLSDLLFALARLENHRAGEGDRLREGGGE